MNVKRAVEQSVIDWEYLSKRQVEYNAPTYCNSVILDSSPCTDADLIAKSPSESVEELDSMLSKLYSVTDGLGLAMPLFDETNVGREIIIAYALVGHGGRTMNPKHRSRKIKRRSAGSTNPIYISVGNNITLRDAVTLVAYTCGASRIPEPVREADLYGRSLLRSTLLNSSR